ncbi:MAG: C39 family peptidase [Candidatus Thermoplasmatota archaeon]|nr:C39 family peptidase [Candidatus Thermoplasmatota archaeon]
MSKSLVGRVRFLISSVCVCIVAMMVLPAAGTQALSGSAFIEGVPLYQQIDAKGCGAVSLQMVFDYCGEFVDQREIYNAARSGGTALPDMARAAQFSSMSPTMGVRWPNSIVTGYTARDMGYAGFYYASDVPWLNEMKAILDQGYPVIVLVYWLPEWYSGDHYRVVVGYDDSEGVLLINDGWSREFKNDHDYQGSTSQAANPNAWDSEFEPIKWKYADFLDTWTCDTTRWNVPGMMYGGVFVAPWEIDISAPSSVVPGEKFKVTAEITYPCLAPFGSTMFPTFPAESFGAVLETTTGLNVCKSPDLTGLTTFSAGDTVTIEWELCACKNEGTYGFDITASGLVSGSLDVWKDYPAYDYLDMIGGTSSFAVEVAA